MNVCGMDYLAYILVALVVATRVAFWVKWRKDDRGRQLGISTLQLLIVIIAAAIIAWFPPATFAVFLGALIGIIALSFVPAQKSRT